jgi:hypothetical protein
MIKEYCDICGKEVVTDKYFLPVMKDSYVRANMAFLWLQQK